PASTGRITPATCWGTPSTRTITPPGDRTAAALSTCCAGTRPAATGWTARRSRSSRKPASPRECSVSWSASPRRSAGPSLRSTAAEATRLEAAFDTLFGTETTYGALNVCIRRTQAHKAKLLRVLLHPELPLHNNPAELAARRRVRKRDVSFGPRSPTGVRAWDTFQGLVETTRKLGIRFWAYLRDRLTQAGEIPPLADLIAERAVDQALGASWAAT